MANQRKPLSKKIRFEVFKRDKFTCQYCGRSVPDVVLHVDHIKPVAKGGKNDIMNLITSCSDCNLGKGARELSDDTVVKKQQRRIQELADKNEQLEMLLQWREELQDFENKKVDTINSYIGEYTGSLANEKGKATIKKWLKEFPVDLILEAVEISYDRYYTGSDRSWELAFDKIGGICNNKSYDKEHGNVRYYSNYIKKACKNKYGCWDEEIINHYVFNYIKTDKDFETVKTILHCSRYWGDFKENMREEFETLFK